MTCSPKTELKREDNRQRNIYRFVTRTHQCQTTIATRRVYGNPKPRGSPSRWARGQAQQTPGLKQAEKRRRHPRGGRPGTGIERLRSCARGYNPGTVHGSGAGDCRVQRKECRPEHEWERRWSGKAGKEGAVTGP